MNITIIAVIVVIIIIVVVIVVSGQSSSGRVISNINDPEGIKSGKYKQIPNNNFFSTNPNSNWNISVKFNLDKFNNTSQSIIGNMDNNNGWGLWITPLRKLQWKIGKSSWDLNNLGELKDNTPYLIDIKYNNGKYSFSLKTLEFNKSTENFQVTETDPVVINAGPINTVNGAVTLGGVSEGNVNNKFLGSINEVKSIELAPSESQTTITTPASITMRTSGMITTPASTTMRTSGTGMITTPATTRSAEEVEAERQRQAAAAAEAERQRQAAAIAEAERRRQIALDYQRKEQAETAAAAAEAAAAEAARQRQAAAEARQAAEAERQRQAATIYYGPNNKYFEDNICANIGNINGNLDTVKNSCNSNSSCTAFNYNPTLQNGILRKCVNKNEVPTGIADGWGSYTNYQLPTATTTPRITASQNNAIGKVIIYADGDYTGGSLELGIGTYDSNFLTSRGFNDQISSLKVSQGLQVEGWEHNIGEGRRWVFTSDTNWVGDANDKISSLRISALSSAGTSTGSNATCDRRDNSKCIFKDYTRAGNTCNAPNSSQASYGGLDGYNDNQFVGWLDALYDRNAGSDSNKNERSNVVDYVDRCKNQSGYSYLNNTKAANPQSINTQITLAGVTPVANNFSAPIGEYSSACNPQNSSCNCRMDWKFLYRATFNGVLYQSLPSNIIGTSDNCNWYWNPTIYFNIVNPPQSPNDIDVVLLTSRSGENNWYYSNVPPIKLDRNNLRVRFSGTTAVFGNKL